MKNYNLQTAEFDLNDGECYIIQMKEVTVDNPDTFRTLYIQQFAANLASLSTPKYATLYISREEAERFIPMAELYGEVLGIVQIKDVLEPYFRLRAYECNLHMYKYWDGNYDEPYNANGGMCCDGGIPEYKFHMLNEYEAFKEKYNELKIDTINNCYKVIIELMNTKL